MLMSLQAPREMSLLGDTFPRWGSGDRAGELQVRGCKEGRESHPWQRGQHEQRHGDCQRVRVRFAAASSEGQPEAQDEDHLRSVCCEGVLLTLFHEPLQQPWGPLPAPLLQAKGLRLRCHTAAKWQNQRNSSSQLPPFRVESVLSASTCSGFLLLDS